MSKFNKIFEKSVIREADDRGKRVYMFDEPQREKIDKLLTGLGKEYAWHEGQLALDKNLGKDRINAILKKIDTLEMGKASYDAELSTVYMVDDSSEEKEEDSQAAKDFLTTAKTNASDALFFLTVDTNFDLQKSLAKAKECSEAVRNAISELEKMVKN